MSEGDTVFRTAARLRAAPAGAVLTECDLSDRVGTPSAVPVPGSPTPLVTASPRKPSEKASLLRLHLPDSMWN